MSVSLLMSPLTVSYCRRKSIRLTAVLGGLISSLACLFASFALQYHQLVLSYGFILGLGVGMTRDTATLMVGQYFKRRREVLEIMLVSARGVGVCLLYTFVRIAIRYFISTMFYNYTLKGRARSPNYRQFTFITYLLRRWFYIIK